MQRTLRGLASAALLLSAITVEAQTRTVAPRPINESRQRTVTIHREAKPSDNPRPQRQPIEQPPPPASTEARENHENRENRRQDRPTADHRQDRPREEQSRQERRDHWQEGDSWRDQHERQNRQNADRADRPASRPVQPNYSREVRDYGGQYGNQPRIIYQQPRYPSPAVLNLGIYGEGWQARVGVGNGRAYDPYLYPTVPGAYPSYGPGYPGYTGSGQPLPGYSQGYPQGYPGSTPGAVPVNPGMTGSSGTVSIPGYGSYPRGIATHSAMPQGLRERIDRYNDAINRYVEFLIDSQADDRTRQEEWYYRRQQAREESYNADNGLEAQRRVAEMERSISNEQRELVRSRSNELTSRAREVRDTYSTYLRAAGLGR